MAGASARLLADGRRLHLQHGPIDVILQAWGEAAEVARARHQAAAAFDGLLDGLVAELPLLRMPIDALPTEPRGAVARRMVEAVRPYAGVFVTPLAAVAGAVADHLLEALVEGRRLRRAYVNDGGDIALHLAAGERLTLGLLADVDDRRLDGQLGLTAADPVRGVATSGRGGRSFSLGIADAVTVLAASAAAADAAATLIANAVDAEHPAIHRLPASTLDPDSDLGDRPVTRDVGPLPGDLVEAALAAGAGVAEGFRRRGLITAALLRLQGGAHIVGPLPLLQRHGCTPAPARAEGPEPRPGGAS